MDRITFFKYAYGGIEDLRTGNFDSMQSAIGIESLDLSLPAGIIIPRFVGIYQDWRAIAETSNERQLKEKYEEYIKDLEKKFYHLIKIGLGKEGRKERFDPKLIHIGYDARIYKNKELVRGLLGEGSERLGISAYEDLPHFYDKNVVLEEVYMEQLRQVPFELDEDDVIERIVKIAKEGYSKLTEQLKRFGLTRDEFAILYIFDTLRNGPDTKFLDINELLFGRGNKN